MKSALTAVETWLLNKVLMANSLRARVSQIADLPNLILKRLA